MKQNPPTAKNGGAVAIVLLVVLTVSGLACTRPSLSDLSRVQATQDPSATEGFGKTNINTATPRELEKLPGIGQVLAERIVAHRQEHGPFRRVEHLMLVRGISEAKFRAIRSMIVIG